MLAVGFIIFFFSLTPSPVGVRSSLLRLLSSFECCDRAIVARHTACEKIVVASHPASTGTSGGWVDR